MSIFTFEVIFLSGIAICLLIGIIYDFIELWRDLQHEPLLPTHHTGKEQEQDVQKGLEKGGRRGYGSVDDGRKERFRKEGGEGKMEDVKF